MVVLMNYETRLDPPEPAVVETAPRRLNRRVVLVAIVAALLAIVLAGWFLNRPTSSEAQVATATDGKGGESGADDQPVVTVAVPGRSGVSRTLTASGTLAARRQVPIGVVGEGGRVVRVLVDAGSWVKRGQALVVVDRSVQAQQIAGLRAPDRRGRGGPAPGPERARTRPPTRRARVHLQGRHRSQDGDPRRRSRPRRHRAGPPWRRRRRAPPGSISRHPLRALSYRATSKSVR